VEHKLKKIWKNSLVSDEGKMIEYLILQNALEVSGIDSATGELLYSITAKMKEVMPDLYDDHLNFVHTEILELWQQGFLEINFMEDDPTVSLTEKTLDQDELSKLTKQQLWSLEELKRVSKNKEI